MKTILNISSWLLFFILISPTTAHAQTGEIRGMVTDRQTGQPLEVATVSLKQLPEGSLKGTTTDSDGVYRFRRLEPGNYALEVRYIGYVAFRDTLQLSRSQSYITQNIRLEQSAESLDEVVVSHRNPDLVAGQKKIQPEDFRRAPTPAGSADLAGYLQTQPGVVAVGDRGGQLFVRGGTPSENLVLMDGTLIYQPFHIIGFFSVFPEEVVSRADLYAGGFGPRYSGRTSSVMDVRLRNGNLYEQNWSASVSPFISDLFFERPVREGKSSLLVSLRGSLIEESSKQYLEEQQPLKFNSQLIKFSSVAEQGVNCSAFFMRTYDRGKLDFEQGDTFKWNNVVTGGRCAGVSEGSSVTFLDANFGISYFSNNAGREGTIGRNSSIFKSHLDVNLRQDTGILQLDYGIFTNIRNTDYDISDRFIGIQSSRETFLSTGIYLNLNLPLGQNISMDPGFSYTSYLRRFRSSFEPRLQISWQPRGREDEELHAAFGVYRQPLVGLSDFRDAGTAFTAWMSVPNENHRMEALHAIVGWRQPIGPFWDVSVEGYFKDIRNTPVAVWSSAARFTTDLAYANGTVQGLDARLDFNHRHLYLSIGYGYSITEYETAQDHFGTWFGEPVQKYNPPHDRRHQFNAQAGLEIGNFSANISWLYGSGLPFTRPMGFDSFFSFENGLPNVTRDYGEPRVLLEKPFQGRFPDFHRLDVSLQQAFHLQRFRIKIQMGAINAYNTENLFYYDVFNQKGINQLPLMPYVALKMGTK